MGTDWFSFFPSRIPAWAHFVYDEEGSVGFFLKPTLSLQAQGPKVAEWLASFGIDSRG